jgi:hypothetical protein
MMDFLNVAFRLGDADYTVAVELHGGDAGEVVEIFDEAGRRISVTRWEALGFDEYTLGDCVTKALKEDRRRARC